MIDRKEHSQSSPFVFAHQSKWQQDMLQLYGSYMCSTDATYSTTVYDMPLFFLCVFSNVGYVNAATFLLSDERLESIASGINQITKWNPEWKPTQLITDFHKGQIAVLEATFPGALHTMC